VSGDTQPRPNAVVQATWRVITIGGRGVAHIENVADGLDTRTDSNGVYRLCGVPTITDITVQAIVDSLTRNFKTVRLRDDQRLGRLDFTLDPGVTALASFAGSVVDSLNNPLVNAEVLLPELSLSARTDARGAFRIDRIRPGTHKVVIRRDGYSAMEANALFEAGQELTRRIVLARPLS
jgi:hypothetical protein